MGEGYQIGEYFCVFGHQLYSRVGHQPGMVANPARGELNRKTFFFKGEGERRRGQLRGMSPGNLFQASSPTVHRDAEFSFGGQLRGMSPGNLFQASSPTVHRDAEFSVGGQLRGMSPGNLFKASSPTAHRDAEFSSGGQLKGMSPGNLFQASSPTEFSPIIRDPWYFVSGRPLVARSDWGAI